MTSFETESIPDFLLTRVEDLDEEPLRSVAKYAKNPVGTPPEDVPENIANPLYIQSEDVCEAVAEYAEGLAEGGDGPETDADEDDEGDEDDDDPSFMMGPAFG